MRERSCTAKESTSLSCKGSKEDSGKTEKTVRAAAVSVSRDKKSKDNGMSLGGVGRHWRSTKGPQRRASTLEKSDLFSTAGDKIYD